MLRLFAVLVLALWAAAPAAAADVKPAMGQGEPCGEAPNYLCVSGINGDQTKTINSLKVNFPASGAVSVTLMASLECGDSLGTVTVQIMREKDGKPLNVAGATRVEAGGSGNSSAPISIVSYFPVKKGKTTFYARYHNVAGSSGPGCTINNGTMGYTYIPD